MKKAFRSQKAKVFLSLLSVSSLGACVATENLVTDMITSETNLPPEVRMHETLSTEDLVTFGQAGIKEFEIARRFEAGTFGFPRSEACALSFFRSSGQTRTVLSEDRLAGGAGQRITYLGFPQARAAAHRLEARGVSAAPSQGDCISSIRGASR